MFSGFFFFSKLFYKTINFLFTAVNSLHSFSQPQIRTPGWEGNFLITASSKDKTFCHLLYSLQKQKPPVKIIKTCCQNIKTIKTTCHLLYSLQKQKPPVKIIKTCCQNLLSKHQNHQNHLSKSSKPAVKTSKPSKPPVKIIKTCCQNIKTIKTTCQNHQNLLSITSKPSKPPVKTSKPTVMTT